MNQISLPDISQVAERIRTSREERAWLKKLFRVLQEAKRLGIEPSQKEVVNADQK